MLSDFPILNAENKKLQAHIEALEKELSAVTIDVQDVQSRTTSMQHHYKNVEQEMKHMRSLQEAKNRQVASEENLKTLLDSEAARMLGDIKKFEKEMHHVAETKNLMIAQLYHQQQKKETMESEMIIDKQQLEEWKRVENEKLDDFEAIAGYEEEDAAKVKQILLETERLLADIQRLENELGKEVTDTHITRLELKKMTDTFRQTHLERKELLNKWEESIKQISKRDNDIQAKEQELMLLNDDISKFAAVMREKQAELDVQKEIGKEAETKFEQAERDIQAERMEMQRGKEALTEFSDETDILRAELIKAANGLNQTKAKSLALANEKKEAEESMEGYKQTLNELQKKLETISCTTSTIEAKAAQLEKIFEAEETTNKQLEKQLKQLKENLHKAKADEKSFTAEVTGSNAALKNLQSKCQRFDQEVLNQQTLVYNQEFQIQQLERKIRRAMGDRTDEERDALEKNITTLNEKIETADKTLAVLGIQLKKSLEENRRSQKTVHELKLAKSKYGERMDDLELENSSAATQLKIATKEKEEKMVEASILKLEKNKLASFLNARSDQVFSLKNRRVELSLALQDKTNQVQMHMSMLMHHKKTAENHRQSCQATLREKQHDIDMMKRRYELIIESLGPDEGEKSQAYYVIKAAQDREALKKEGDDLDGKIKKAEREIKAMQNTLGIMNGKNSDFRQNTLEQQFKSAIDLYKEKRREIDHLHADVAEFENELKRFTEKEAEKLHFLAEIEERIALMEKDIRQQGDKKERASKQLEKLSKFFKRNNKSDQELDAKYKTFREANSMIVAMLAEKTEKHSELVPKLQMLCSQAGVSLPSHSRPGTRRFTSDTASIKSGGSMKSIVSNKSRVSMYSTRSKPDMQAHPNMRSPSSIQVNFPELAK